MGKSSRDHTLIKTPHVLTLVTGDFTIQVAAPARAGIPPTYAKELCAQISALSGIAPMAVTKRNAGTSKKLTLVPSGVFIQSVINTHNGFTSSMPGDIGGQTEPYFHLYITRLGDKVPIPEVFTVYPELEYLLTVAWERSHEDFVLDIGVRVDKDLDDAFILWQRDDDVEYLVPPSSITLHKLFNQEDMGTLQFNIRMRGQTSAKNPSDPEISVKVYNGLYHLWSSLLSKKVLRHMPRSTVSLVTTTADITESTEEIIRVVLMDDRHSDVNTRSEYTVHWWTTLNRRSDDWDSQNEGSPEAALQHMVDTVLTTHDSWTQPRRIVPPDGDTDDYGWVPDLDDVFTSVDNRLPFKAHRLGFHEFADHWLRNTAYAKGLKGGDLKQGFHKGSTSANQNVTIRKQQVFAWWKSLTGLCTTWHESWRKKGATFMTRISAPEEDHPDDPEYKDPDTNEMHRDAVRFAESLGYTEDTFKPVSSAHNQEVFDILLENFRTYAKYGHVQGPWPRNRPYQRYAVHKRLKPGENAKSQYMFPGKNQKGPVPPELWCDIPMIGTWVLTFRCGISWPHQIKLQDGISIAQVYEDMFDKLPRDWSWQPGQCPENPDDMQEL